MIDMWYVDCTDPVFGAPVGKRNIPVHHPDACIGRPCVVHNPSGHHMVNWSLLWRADIGVAERICVHGTGHPDPDDVAYRKSTGDEWLSVHGCDGCCQQPEG